MITISPKAYSQIAREMVEYHRQDQLKKRWGPDVFLLLGKSPGHIDKICLLIRGHQGTGCSMMTLIPIEPMVKKSVESMKKGYLVLGVVRIGNFTRPGSLHSTGTGPLELEIMNKNALFMTVDHTSIKVARTGRLIPWRIK